MRQGRIAAGALAGVAALAFGAAVEAADGVDLVVSGIVPSATQSSKILVIVRNLGERTLYSTAKVELRLDGELVAERRSSASMEPRKPVHVEFPRLARVSAGIHTLTAVIDPKDEVREMNERNNSTDATIYVREAVGEPEPDEASSQTGEGGEGN